MFSPRKSNDAPRSCADRAVQPGGMKAGAGPVAGRVWQCQRGSRHCVQRCCPRFGTKRCGKSLATIPPMIVARKSRPSPLSMSARSRGMLILAGVFPNGRFQNSAPTELPETAAIANTCWLKSWISRFDFLERACCPIRRAETAAMRGHDHEGPWPFRPSLTLFVARAISQSCKYCRRSGRAGGSGTALHGRYRMALVQPRASQQRRPEKHECQENTATNIRVSGDPEGDYAAS